MVFDGKHRTSGVGQRLAEILVLQLIFPYFGMLEVAVLRAMCLCVCCEYGGRAPRSFCLNIFGGNVVLAFGTFVPSLTSLLQPLPDMTPRQRKQLQTTTFFSQDHAI
jgi:hypothetical protein